MNAVALNLAILIFGTLCLVAWQIPLGLRIASFMFAGLDGPLSPIFYSWANILCSGDAQVRAFTLATMNSFGSAVATLMQQFAYPVTDAPEFHLGYRVSLGLVIGMCLWVCVVRVCEIRAVNKTLDRNEDAEAASESEMSTEPTRIGVAAETKA
jgi:MFS transporter, ACS family, pantothenate transporter